MIKSDIRYKISRLSRLRFVFQISIKAVPVRVTDWKV